MFKTTKYDRKLPVLRTVFHARISYALLLILCLCSSTGMIGCSSKSSPTPAENSTESAPKQTTAENQSSPSKTDQVSDSNNDPDRKYVDGIPYDVFYDRPLTVAAENTSPPPATNNMAATSTPQMNSNGINASTPPPTTETPPPATAASSGWDEVITKDRLIEEITRIRNALTANLNSVGSFNRELLPIQIDSATLAALSGIATQHPGDFTWKDKAHFVRDMSSEIAMAAETRGRPAFEVAETQFLNIIEILNGGTPAELPESDPETVFSDVADRNLLMKKIKEYNDWFRTTISGDSELKSKKEDVIAKAALLRALGQVVHLEDYVFADEAEYQEYCQELIDGSAKMLEGAETDDYTLYDTGFQLLNKSCNDCHPVYLNN
ncbi:MAG TPA: hypothetical protein DD473_03935 [Planctomycetaceae bacterium]|nr:hypothetical protein [Planctomycetaceae bacterium]